MFNLKVKALFLLNCAVGIAAYYYWSTLVACITSPMLICPALGIAVLGLAGYHWSKSQDPIISPETNENKLTLKAEILQESTLSSKFDNNPIVVKATESVIENMRLVTDVLDILVRKTSVNDLVSFRLVCKDWFNRVEAFVPSNMLFPFLNEINNVQNDYPESIISDFSNAKYIAVIPLLRTESLAYGRFNLSTNTNTTSTPLINLYVKNNETHEIKSAFANYSLGPDNSKNVLWKRTDALPEKTYKDYVFRNYLKRLCNNEPCGKIVNGKEVEPTIYNEKPLMQLCDEKGEIINISKIKDVGYASPKRGLKPIRLSI